jgi:hypothetical protein
MMRRLLWALVLCLGLTAIGGGAVVVPGGNESRLLAHEHEGQNDERGGCTVRRLRGVWSVLATGFVVTPPAGSGIPAGPFATVGTLAIDGEGHARLTATRSFNGTIVSEADLPGMIALTELCTGSAAFQGGRTFDVVVLDGFREMNWIQTNPGAVVTVVFKRL